LNGAETLLAFDNPWHIVGLIGAIVAIRVAVPRMDMSRSTRVTILEFVDSGLVAALLVFCLLRPFVIQAFFIPSGSMMPTLQTGDRILVNKFVFFFRDPEPGDIVVFNAPPAASPVDRDFIKRIVGAPGDEICVKDGALYRNGERLAENYIAEDPRYTWPRGSRCLPVPERNYVMFGDNRNDSNDSHRWEEINPTTGRVEPRPFVPRENVLGKAMVIFWPPQRIQVLR
jgi:signal peptidase I